MPLGRRPLDMSRAGEAKTARDIRGRTTPGSGNTPWAKGDVRSATLLVERKDTAGLRYTLKADELIKHRQQAILADRIPVFLVALNGSTPPLEVAVMDARLAFELLEKQDATGE